MFVCSCLGVTDRTVEAAIAAGAITIEDVARCSGAGSQCGGCWPTLERLLLTMVDREVACAGATTSSNSSTRS